MRHRLTWIACVGATLLATPGAAQVVELRLREDSTRVLVPGAIVRLLADTGVVALGLTDELGRITLRAPAPGRYRLQADRIGYRGLLSEPMTLTGAEPLRLELLMSSARVLLPTLVVRGESQCDARGGGEEGPLAAALWEEIRKALTANLLTQQYGAVPLHVRTFEREVSRTGDVERERVTGAALVRGQPFAALPPASLARTGFVYGTPDSATFAAPDAALLLSDEFVTTHCFQAVPGPDDLIGLGFEPVRGRRVPDVRGTLWVDRATSELRSLEYAYTGLRAELGRANLGGRLDFQALPTGAWIVSYWHIRMPRMEMRSLRARTVSLVGYLDQGGRAEVPSAATERYTRAVVAGQVHDSLAGGGLVGAVVRVHGWPDSAVTDRAGRFHLALTLTGRRVVAVQHPRLGLLPDGSSRELQLTLGDTTLVTAAVPPAAAFARVFCGAGGGRAGLVGITWGEDGTPTEGLTVRVTWRPTAAAALEERSRSGPRGLYAICDLPPGESLPLRLEAGGRVLVERTLRLEWGEFRWLELRP